MPYAPFQSAGSEDQKSAIRRSASADAAIRLMDDAALANVECRYRKGALVELPSEGELMITGDLHGNRNNFLRLVRAANLSLHTDRHLVLQELVHDEDVARDGACRSYQLVEMAARLKATFPDRIHLLLGNHEFAELNNLPIAKHGIELNDLFRDGLIKAYGVRWRDVKDAYERFWRSLPLAVVTRGGAFICHSTPSGSHLEGITRKYLSGLNPGDGLTRKSPAYYLVWGRDYSRETADKFGEQTDASVFIVAHTPCDEGCAVPSHRHFLLDSSSPDACHLIIPLSRKFTPKQLLKQVRRLSGAAAPTRSASMPAASDLSVAPSPSVCGRREALRAPPATEKAQGCQTPAQRAQSATVVKRRRRKKAKG